MQEEEKQGIIIVAVAYVLWGFMPIFWKLLNHVSSDEILAGRVIWSFVFTLLLVVIGRNYKQLIIDIQELWKDRKAFWSLVLASYLVTGNWFIFIYAVNAGYIVQTSLGYYINPLLSVVLGIVFLKEKLSRAQVLAVVIAAIGVLILSISYGQVPWIAFSLAITFAFYGLIKKTLKVDALRGLTIETFFVLPVALIYFAYLVATEKAVFFSTDVHNSDFACINRCCNCCSTYFICKGNKKYSFIFVWVYTIYCTNAYAFSRCNHL